MIKYYERTLYKATAWDFIEKKPKLILTTEYVATEDIRRFNYRKKVKFEESPYAKEFFKNNPDFIINRVYQVEHWN